MIHVAQQINSACSRPPQNLARQHAFHARNRTNPHTRVTRDRTNTHRVTRDRGRARRAGVPPTRRWTCTPRTAAPVTLYGDAQPARTEQRRARARARARVRGPATPHTHRQIRRYTAYRNAHASTSTIETNNRECPATRTRRTGRRARAASMLNPPRPRPRPRAETVAAATAGTAAAATARACLVPHCAEPDEQRNAPVPDETDETEAGAGPPGAGAVETRAAGGTEDRTTEVGTGTCTGVGGKEGDPAAPAETRQILKSNQVNANHIKSSAIARALGHVLSVACSRCHPEHESAAPARTGGHRGHRGLPQPQLLVERGHADCARQSKPTIPRERTPLQKCTRSAPVTNERMLLRKITA